MKNKTLQKKGKLAELLRSREVSLLLVLVLLCAFIQFRNDQFLTANVINGIFKNYAYTMVMSFGMLLVLLIVLLVKYRKRKTKGAKGEPS